MRKKDDEMRKKDDEIEALKNVWRLGLESGAWIYPAMIPDSVLPETVDTGLAALRPESENHQNNDDMAWADIGPDTGIDKIIEDDLGQALRSNFVQQPPSDSGYETLPREVDCVHHEPYAHSTVCEARCAALECGAEIHQFIRPCLADRPVGDQSYYNEL